MTLMNKPPLPRRLVRQILVGQTNIQQVGTQDQLLHQNHLAGLFKLTGFDLVEVDTRPHNLT